MIVSAHLHRLMLLIVIVILVGSARSQNADRSTYLSHHLQQPALNHHQQQQQQQQQSSRPTQFGVLSGSQASPVASSRSALILPANNEIQVSNFQLPNHPMKPPPSVLQSPTKTSTTTVSTSTSDQTNYRASPKQTPTQVGGGFLTGNLELALRQASGDESVFQPSPAMGLSGHNTDWVLQSIPSHSNGGESLEPRTHLPQVSATTEQNNNIIQLAEVQQPSAPLNEVHHRLSYDPDQFTHQKEYPSVSGVPLNYTELNNQVTYEGPATAPPPGDYYFSSSEKLPNTERASNSWWALGFGQEYERVNNLTRDDYTDYCAKSEFLISNKQRSLCRLHPKVMPIVAKGLRLAVDECQSRFASSRWNCSLIMQNSMTTEKSDDLQIFGDVMKRPNRERSFLNAIVAAGLAHAMTKACSQGELPEECSCDKRIKSKNNKGKIEWVACSDDIDFGAKFSRDFTDSADGESDTSTMINTHNNEVGRRVFKSATDITCTCQNGENGLCQTKRCWKHLGPFSDIGDELVRRYESATHVQLSSRDPHKLRPVRRGVRKPKRKDLVYFDESPDYCSSDPRIGVLGTQNRRCNSTSSGQDSCSLLCCGRGHQVFLEELEEDCNCKFVWCCQVKCDKCKRHITADVCN